MMKTNHSTTVRTTDRHGGIVVQCRLLFFVSFLGIPLMLTMRYAEGVRKS